MNRRRKILIYVVPLVVVLMIGIWTYIFLLGRYYWNQIPEYPDFSSEAKVVRDQIKDAGRKAYLIPSAANLGNLGMVYHSATYYEKAAICYRLAVKKAAEKKRDRSWIWSYYLGYLSLEMGESKAAIENFSDVTKKNPGNYQALYYSGEAWQNLGNTENAKSIFKRIAALNEADTWKRSTLRESYFPLQAYALFRLGRIHLNSGNPDSAKSVLNEIIRRYWTFGPAYRLLGEVYTRTGDPETGRKYITRSNDLAEYTAPADTLADKIAMISRSDKYLLKVIDDAKMSYNFKLAHQLCNHSIKFLPENKYILSNAILINFVLGLNNEVLPLLQNHRELFSDDSEELMKVADLLYGKGFHKEAMEYFNTAIKAEPGATRLAMWLESTGQKNEAAALLDEQIKKDPDNENNLTDAVRLYMNINETDKALSYLERLKKLYPDNVEAKKATGLFFERQGKQKEALAIYEEITKSGSKDMSIYKYLNSVYLKEKRWDAAISNMKLALEDFPNDPDILNGMANLLIGCPEPKLRNIPEGKELAERAYINYKCSPPTRLISARNLATAYAILGEKETASKYIQITLNMANHMGRNSSIPADELVPYFENLKRQFGL